MRAFLWLPRILGLGLVWVPGAMVLTVMLIVTGRYVLNTSNAAMQETLLYLHGVLIAGGMGYTLTQDSHVRLDIFRKRMSPKLRLWIDRLGVSFFLLPFCALIIWSSWDYVADAWAIREKSSEAGGLPVVYVQKSLLLAFPVLLALAGIGMALNKLGKQEGDNKPPNPS